MESALEGDVRGDPVTERFKGHHTEVLVTSGAHRDGTSSPFLIADDKDVRALLHRMLTYFIRDFLVSQVQVHPKPLIFQHLCDIAGVIGLGIGDIEHRELHRREPDRQRAGVLFDQNADEALPTMARCSMMGR